MHFPILLTGLMASSALAAPHYLSSRTSSNPQNVVYWGQNGGSAVENTDLSSYCTSTSGVDIIVLAFLYQYGGGVTTPSGTIGQSCAISTSGAGSNCDDVASSIAKCQAAGVKIILSLGGATGTHTLASTSEAETIGQYLWDSYGNSASPSAQRPFGKNFVNGFDFDIESPGIGNEYYPALISKLRSNFASDSANTYYITGAPQCPIPEPNMGTIISNSTFDYLFIQFYNNDCGLPFNGNTGFNYDDWVTFTAGTPSSNAELFIGVPAAPLGSNGLSSGAKYYGAPADLATVIGEYKSHTRFGGVMEWAADWSDSNVIDGCTYAQQVHAILSTGKVCSGGPSSSGGSTTTAVSASASATATASASATASATGIATASATPTAVPTSVPTSSGNTTTTSTGTGSVIQWGQCGGSGYTGPTACASPYKCVSTSTYWSQCE